MRKIGAFASPQPDRRPGCEFDGQAGFGQAGGGFFARGLEGIDAQVERGRLVERGGERTRLALTVLSKQAIEQPVRQIELHAERQLFQVQCAGPFDERCGIAAKAGVGERAAACTLQRHEAGSDDRFRGGSRGRAAARQVLEKAPAPQAGVHGFGNVAAVARAKLRVGAKVALHLCVRRRGAG